MTEGGGEVLLVTACQGQLTSSIMDNQCTSEAGRSLALSRKNITIKSDPDRMCSLLTMYMYYMRSMYISGKGECILLGYCQVKTIFVCLLIWRW